MKNQLRKLLNLALLLSLIILSSCEKDLYDDAIIENTKSKINYVTIEQVPFLIPEIQEFNPDYAYLSSPNKTSVNRESLNLNLDLNRIIEYIQANGLKTYSIIIKNDFEEYDNKYFENLTVFEIDGEYESLVFKYDPVNDNQDFNLNTFTGEVEIKNIEGELFAIMGVEDGNREHYKPFDDHITIYYSEAHIDIYPDGTIVISWTAHNGAGGGGTSSSGGTSGTGSSGSSGGTSGGVGTGGGGGGGGELGSGIFTAGVYPNPPTKYEQFVTNLGEYADDFQNLDLDVQAVISQYVTDNNDHFISAPVKNFLISIFINPTTNTWFTNQTTATQLSVFNYVAQNNFSTESRNFMNWGINYLIANPTTTFEQFQNWFMTPREGKDGDYDESFWENPNLNFPQQQLPTFQAFDTAYPRADGASLIQLIGGDVLAAYTNNPNDVRGFCALKVSRGLNGANITIPNLPGKTIKGGDNKYYFLNAKALNKWMRKTFGVNPLNSNHLHLTAAQGGINGVNFPSLTANIKGIFSMVTNDPNHTWASGHADLINNGNCVFGCHFNDVPASILDYIDIWILN